MKIIVLTGNKNTGKTETLKLVGKYFEDLEKGYICSKEQVGNMDVSIDFDYLIRYKNKIIRIYTLGDYVSIFKRTIAEIKKKTSQEELNIDVLIIAYRMGLNEALDKNILTLNGYDKVIQKSKADLKDKQRAFDEILAALEAII